MKTNKNTYYYKDNFDTYPIPIKSKDGEVNFTIYLTEDQLSLLKAKGLNKISYRKLERLRESTLESRSYYIFPIVEYTPEGGIKKRQHLGNFLYPEIQSPWNDSIWKDRAWDFRRCNINIGPTNTTKCESCSNWAEKSSPYCNSCNHLRNTLSLNKIELNRNNLKHLLSEDKLKILFETTHCEISGIPMVFQSNSGLKAVSIDRIDKKKDLTDDNILLVLTGLNQLRASSSYSLFIDFLNKTDSSKGVDIELNSLIRTKLNEMYTQSKHRYMKKELTENIEWDILKEDLYELLKETKGICKITNVPLDLEFKTPRSIFKPSFCRIDLNKGYITGNVQIVSLGANRLLSLGYSNEECKRFYREVIEGYRKKNKKLGGNK